MIGFRKTACVAIAAVGLSVSINSTAIASDAAELEASAKASLAELLAGNENAATLMKEAKAVLVFPTIGKAGFIIGVEGGDGAMLKGGKAVGYYRSLGASYGLQAGITKVSYAMFFLDDASVAYLDKSSGWEIGTGPTVVIADKGLGKKLSTTTLRDGVYAFFYGQTGLMAGISLQGTKITKITPDAEAESE